MMAKTLAYGGTDETAPRTDLLDVQDVTSADSPRGERCVSEDIAKPQTIQTR
jgi:hypothetical protein